MPTVILARVTLLHPEVYLPNVHRLSHLTQSRQAKDERFRQLEREGLVALKRAYRDAPRLDSGTEVRRFTETSLRGELLARFVGEPRVVHIPDELPPKAKWKIEFRRKWADGTGMLDQDTLDDLMATMARSILRVKALWIMDTINRSEYAEPKWANLVVVALRSPRSARHADFTLELLEELPYVRWK
jgi:hypothetical protein